MTNTGPVLTTDDVVDYLKEVFPQVFEMEDTVVVEAVGHNTARVRQIIDRRHLRPGGTISGPTMFRLADLATQLEAARQLVLHAARMKDAGLPCLTEAAMAKLFASEAAERIVSGALQTFGGMGYVRETGIERIARDVRVCQIYEGTSDIQKLIIARALSA